MSSQAKKFNDMKATMETTTIFFDGDTVIVTENTDGEIYLIKSKYIQDILDDWRGD